MRTPALATLVGLTLFPAALPVAAEEASRTQGPRVRVTSAAAPSGPIIGILVGLDEKTLTVWPSNEEGDLRLERASITTLEVSRRRGNRGKGVAIGALVGAGVALGLGLATGGDCQAGDLLCFDKGTTSGLYGVLTVPAGALLGLAFSHGEKWETTTPDRLQVAVRPMRGGVALSVSFGF